MTAETLPAPEIWAKAVDRIKDRVNNRTLWETLEQAVGLTIEDNIFIIGLHPRIFNHSGLLTVPQHANVINAVLSELAGQPLRSRVIEGDTLEDWAFVKSREARAAVAQNRQYERREQQYAQSGSWDALLDEVSRAYSTTPLRQLPQSRARYLTDMLYTIADAMSTLYPDVPDDATERSLARVIDRVAQNAEVPAALVALEVERLRAWRTQNPE
jgi:hypothetical protein